MYLSDFDYTLPDDLIATHPEPARRDSRLLVVGDEFEDARFADLPGLLDERDLLVFNDTRVIRARLRGRKDSGGKVEVLIERLTGECTALAQVRASKSPQPGSTLLLPDNAVVTVEGRAGEMFNLDFARPVQPYLDAHGAMPLPPYLGREEESADDERYQTVYARHHGAVAAPTAGLHFDEQMLVETRDRGIDHAYVTLHVGAGTFQPLRDDDIEANRLHAERLVVGADVCDAVRAARRRGGRVVAVGTTTVRALEAASVSGTIEPFTGETSLFIRPGYSFHAVDAMLTNFHLPRSSLLMLVAAFAGYERTMAAYRHAVRQRYRFFSYGDAMLVTPEAQ
jgi:S-adenosylmethionine:tRNA ribosyltransferase-isomerase